MVKWHLFWGSATLFMGYGYLHDWLVPLFCVAPVLALIWLLSMPGTLMALLEGDTVAIMPYFRKSGPGEEKNGIEGDTFLHGKALARNCLYLDRIAQIEQVETLSSFGFYDDLRGKYPVWLPAERGLATVSRLLRFLENQPSFWYTEEYATDNDGTSDTPREMTPNREMLVIAQRIGKDIAPLLDDLGRLEAALYQAKERDVPFCLLIRYGNCASGQEMEVRSGYFA